MKKKLISAFSILSIALLSFTAVSTSKVGDSAAKALAVEVVETDGSTDILRTYMGDKGMLLVFSCNTCPFVVAWEDRYNEIDAMCKANGINMVLVNSNAAKREGDDSSEAMAAHAKELGYTMPYVIDVNSEIANLLEAKTTPHVYLLDNNAMIKYKGAIDDNFKDKEAVTETYLSDAIASFAKGEEIKVSETKAMGCSIKRK